VQEHEAAGTFDDLTALGPGQDDIDRQLAQIGTQSQVDDELAKMKAELGTGSGGGDAPALAAPSPSDSLDKTIEGIDEASAAPPRQPPAEGGAS
jgi:phage shock protein A